MTERPLPSPEKLAIVQAAHRVSSVDELSGLGDPEELLSEIGAQVSRMIADYNEDHPFEMTPKSPQDVVAQFETGESVVIFTKNSPLTVLYHGAVYPSFTPAETDILGFQVVESGSAITRDGFRNGLGLGTIGAQMRVELARKLHPNTLTLSTNKQSLTSRVLEHAGIKPENFWDFPYLAYLTCTCKNCSERHGFTACPFRRSKEDSTPEKLAAILDRSVPAGKMDCTLILSDSVMAAAIEERCRDLHRQFEGDPVQPGNITVDTMNRAAWLFAKISEYAKLQSS